MAEYQHLTEERRKGIDIIVDVMREKYSTGEGINWKNIASDFDIIHIQNSWVFQPMSRDIAIRDSGNRYSFVLTNDSIYYPHVIAHEFAHQILGHNRNGDSLNGDLKEDEADYFASQLLSETPSEDSENNRGFDMPGFRLLALSGFCDTLQELICYELMINELNKRGLEKVKIQ